MFSNSWIVADLPTSFFYLMFLICIKETIEPFHPAMKTLLGALKFNSKHGGMLIYNLNCHLGVLDGKSEEQIWMYCTCIPAKMILK